MAVVAAVQVRVDAKNASQQLQSLDQRSKALNGGFKGAALGAKGLGGAIQSALGPILAVSTAVAVLQKSLSTAFARGAAEQRLKNLTDSTQEYKTALAVAANSAEKFGISQTDATQALADVFSRLKGVGFGLKETSEIYDGFNVIAKESGLSSEAASSAFFQLSQALGKGTLNGDEFVTVAEQMPQLLDKIAKTTGASRGELRDMASQGKITSKVLYKALAGAADAAGDLNKKLTPAQKAFNDMQRIIDQLSNQLGNLFAPVVIKGAEALSWAGQKMSEWWDYLGKAVLPRVMRVLQPLINEFLAIWQKIPWDKIVAVWQEGLLQGIEVVLAVLKFVVPILTAIATKIREITESPGFQFVADRVKDVINFLGMGGNKVSEFAEKQKKATEGAAKMKSQYSSMPADVERLVEAQKMQAKSLKEGVKQLEEQKRVIGDQEAAFENAMNITSARLNAEVQINSLHGAQLQDAYSMAKTAEKRLEIAKAIFRNDVEAARLSYQRTINEIDAARRSLEFKRQGAIVDFQTLKARGEIAVLEAKDLKAKEKAEVQAEKALASQVSAIKLIDDQITAQNKVAVYQEQAAAAQYNASVLAAEQALRQKLISDEIGLSKDRANELASRLGDSHQASINLDKGMAGVKDNTEQTAYMMIRVADEADRAATAINNAVTAQLKLNAARGGGSGGGSPVGAAQGAYWPGGFKAFANGGVVTGPTLGLIGEGGEPEYIIPQSKAEGFAKNYLSGARGSSAIPAFAEGGYVGSVNVQTGPVMQQNGVNYVTVADLQGALKQFGDQIARGQRSYGGRRYQGVAG